MIEQRDSLLSHTSRREEKHDRRLEPAPLIHALFEELTETWQYVIADPVTRHAVIIDPRLDSAPASTAVSTIAADRVLSCVRQNSYYVDRILHTHEPTQQGSSAWYLRAQILQATGVAPKITIGKTMAAVQRIFKRKYSMNDGTAWKTDFDTNFGDGEQFALGSLTATALHFPNGTLAYVIGRHIFAGTSIFDLEIRYRHNKLLGDLRAYRIYTSKDSPPERIARLMPMADGHQGERENNRKLVIRYAADNQDIAELE